MQISLLDGHLEESAHIPKNFQSNPICNRQKKWKGYKCPPSKERINNVRAQILQQMEARNIDKLESAKYSVRYFPSKTIMQFDSKTFKQEHEELYMSYCSPKEKEASIVVKRNKEYEE